MVFGPQVHIQYDRSTGRREKTEDGFEDGGRGQESRDVGQPLETGKGTEPLDGTQKDICLIRPNCGLLTSRTIINLCLKPQFYGNLLQHHRKLTHMLIYCLIQSKSERNLRNDYHSLSFPT